MNELPLPLPSSDPGSPATGAVAETPPSVPSQTAPAGTGSQDGGKGKSTPEQRAKWKADKQRQRLAKLASSGGLPPPLPPATSAVDSHPTAAAPDLDGGEAVEDVPLVPWTEDELKDVVEELISLVETWDKSDSVKRARALNLSGELLKQIEQDAEIPAFCKIVFKKYLPRILSKYLNATGASAKYKDEAALVLGALYYVYDKACRSRDLKKLAQPGQSQSAKP